MIDRKKTRTVFIGNVPIGGAHPIVIQSMTNTPTKNIQASLTQIQALGEAGAQIVRLAVLDSEDADALKALVERSPVPLVADIHFDYLLALKAVESGISALRLNPGNIREQNKMALIVEKAAAKNIPIRIGVNAGSLDRTKYSHPTPENMIKSALDHIRILEKMDFYNIKVSLKSSDVKNMVDAYRLFSQERDYPLHLGVTEAGPFFTSAVRSAMGIGSLLMDGIGDTIRVSVSGDPVQEMKIAREILISLGLKKGIKWVACPTCGRTEVDVESIALKLEEKFCHLDAPLTIAVMGCVVNGPGEAKEADAALIGGKNESLIYIRGELYKKIANSEIVREMERAIQWMLLNKIIE